MPAPDPVSVLRYEYFVPGILLFPVKEEWPPIRIETKSYKFSLLKPEWRERPAPDGSGLVLAAAIEGSTSEHQAGVFWPWVQACVAWIQVATGQYNFGARDGFSVRMHGQAVGRDGRTSGFSAAKMEINGAFLTAAMWEEIGVELGQGRPPRQSDLMFVDALRAYGEGNARRVSIMLGVAAEVEVNTLVEELGKAHPDAAVRDLYALISKKRPDFATKLEKIAPILGASPFKGRQPTALADLKKLYAERGTAAHSAVLSDKVPSQLPRFIFAFEDLRDWAREQRKRLGIAQSAVAPGGIRAIPC